MTAVLNFVKLLCVVSVLSGAFWLLLPKGPERKAAHFVLGLFFIWSVTVGVTAFLKIQDFSTVKIAETANASFTENAAQLQKTALERSILQCLETAGFSVEKVECEVHVLENGSINISKAVLYLENGNDFENAASVLQKQPGFNTLGIEKGE